MIDPSRYRRADGENGPDFTSVTTQAEVQALVAAGMLEPVLLFPRRLGGEDSARNRVYLPVGLGRLKEDSEDAVVPLLRQGVLSQLSVNVDYRGASLIPTAIRLVFSDGVEGGRQLVQEYQIWGKGLPPIP